MAICVSLTSAATPECFSTATAFTAATANQPTSSAALNKRMTVSSSSGRPPHDERVHHQPVLDARVAHERRCLATDHLEGRLADPRRRDGARHLDHGGG